MTIKEIADLCGVDERTIYRWTEDPACKVQAEADDKMSSDLFLQIRKKLDSAGHGKPANFTLEETLAIIGEGGKNKALAALLAENAANKNALTTRSSLAPAEWQGKIEAMLLTLMERQALPMGDNEIKARSQKITEEREREFKENGTMILPARKPVTQFICPFFGRSDVVSELSELHDLLKKVESIKSELHRIILRSETPEVIPETVAGKGIVESVNVPIARFVAENIEFTLKESDIIPLYVAYQLYLAYAANPVEEREFGSYIADHYHDITVTKRKADGLDQTILKKCRLRITR